MREPFTKTAAILSISLLLVTGQCFAFCSTAMCAQAALPASTHHGHPSSGHCHNHGGESSHQQDSHSNCPQQQSFAGGLSTYVTYAKLVSHDLAWVMLAPDAVRVASPVLLRSDELVSPPRLP